MNILTPKLEIGFLLCAFHGKVVFSAVSATSFTFGSFQNMSLKAVVDFIYCEIVFP